MTDFDNPRFPLTDEQQKLIAQLLKAATKQAYAKGRENRGWYADNYSESPPEPEPDCDCTDVIISAHETLLCEDCSSGPHIGHHADCFHLTLRHTRVQGLNCPVVEHRRRRDQEIDAVIRRISLSRITRGESLAAIDDLDKPSTDR